MVTVGRQFFDFEEVVDADSLAGIMAALEHPDLMWLGSLLFIFMIFFTIIAIHWKTISILTAKATKMLLIACKPTVVEVKLLLKQILAIRSLGDLKSTIIQAKDITSTTIVESLPVRLVSAVFDFFFPTRTPELCFPRCGIATIFWLIFKYLILPPLTIRLIMIRNDIHDMIEDYKAYHLNMDAEVCHLEVLGYLAAFFLSVAAIWYIFACTSDVLSSSNEESTPCEESTATTIVSTATQTTLTDEKVPSTEAQNAVIDSLKATISELRERGQMNAALTWRLEKQVSQQKGQAAQHEYALQSANQRFENLLAKFTSANTFHNGSERRMARLVAEQEKLQKALAQKDYHLMVAHNTDKTIRADHHAKTERLLRQIDELKQALEQKDQLRITGDVDKVTTEYQARTEDLMNQVAKFQQALAHQGQVHIASTENASKEHKAKTETLMNQVAQLEKALAQKDQQLHIASTETTTDGKPSAKTQYFSSKINDLEQALAQKDHELRIAHNNQKTTDEKAVSQVQGLQNQINDLNQSLAMKDEQLQIAKNAGKLTEGEHHAKTQDLMNHITELNARVHMQQEQIEQNTKNEMEHKDTVTNLEKRLEDNRFLAAKESEESANKIKKLEHELKEKAKSEKNLDKKLKDREAQLQEQITKRENSEDAVRRELSYLRTKFQDEVNKAVAAKLQEAQKSYTQMEEQFITATNAKAEADIRIQDLEGYVQGLQGEVFAGNSEVSELTDEIRKLKEEIEAQNDRYLALSMDFECLLKGTESEKEDLPLLAQCQPANVDEQRIKDLNQAKADVMADKDAESCRLQGRIDQLEEYLANAEAAKTAAIRNLNQCRRERDEEILRVRNEYQGEIGQLQFQIASSDEVQRLRQEIGKKNFDLQHYKDIARQAQHDANRFHQQLQERSASPVKDDQYIQVKKLHNNGATTKKLEDLVLGNIADQETIKNLSKQVADLKAQAQGAEGPYVDVEKEKQLAELSAAVQQEQIRRKKVEVDFAKVTSSLKNDLSALQTELTRRTAELETLRKDAQPSPRRPLKTDPFFRAKK